MELYEVINWQEKEQKDWKLADETWECDAQRIYFYNRLGAPKPTIDQVVACGKSRSAGGHCWNW